MDITLLVVTLGSFAAAVISAAFATGGIYVALAATSAVLPLTIAVPLQPAIMAASLLSRIAYFRADIRWDIVLAFVCGSFVGVLVGARVFQAMTNSSLSLFLGILLLGLIWFPAVDGPVAARLKQSIHQMRFPFVWVGMVHSALGTVFGVGTVLQPLVLRTRMTRAEITGTLAACMVLLDVLKVSSYIAAGFRYSDFMVLVLSAAIAGAVGTWVGKRLAGSVSEAGFRTVFRAIVSLAAVRLIFMGLTG